MIEGVRETTGKMGVKVEGMEDFRPAKSISDFCLSCLGWLLSEWASSSLRV